MKTKTNILYIILLITVLVFIEVWAYRHSTNIHPKEKVIYRTVYKDTPKVDSAKQAIKTIEKKVIVYRDRWNFVHDTLIKVKADTVYILADNIIMSQDSIIMLKDTIINDLQNTLTITRDSLNQSYIIIEDLKTKKIFWQKVSAFSTASNIIQFILK